MIYIDPPHTSPDYMKRLRPEITTFVTADSIEELLRFGDRLNWSEAHFVYPEVYGFVAYDVTERMRLEAIRAGARQTPPEQVEERAKRLLAEWEVLI